MKVYDKSLHSVVWFSRVFKSFTVFLSRMALFFLSNIQSLWATIRVHDTWWFLLFRCSSVDACGLLRDDALWSFCEGFWRRGSWDWRIDWVLPDCPVISSHHQEYSMVWARDSHQKTFMNATITWNQENLVWRLKSEAMKDTSEKRPPWKNEGLSEVNFCNSILVYMSSEQWR